MLVSGVSPESSEATSKSELIRVLAKFSSIEAMDSEVPSRRNVLRTFGLFAPGLIGSEGGSGWSASGLIKGKLEVLSIEIELSSAGRVSLSRGLMVPVLFLLEVDGGPGSFKVSGSNSESSLLTSHCSMHSDLNFASLVIAKLLVK